MGFNYMWSHILTVEAYMECSKLLEIDIRAWHSPSSSACLVLSGAPVAPVLINPQTHCYSNKIWLHISDSKLHWNMTWINIFWRRCKVQNFYFLEVQASYPPDHGSLNRSLSLGITTLLHISSILNWEEMGTPQISFFYIQVMNQEEMEPSHFSMLRIASFFSTRISDIMSNHGSHNCTSHYISLSPHSCRKSRWHCFQDNVTGKSILMWCSARLGSTSNYSQVNWLKWPKKSVQNLRP